MSVRAVWLWVIAACLLTWFALLAFAEAVVRATL